MESFISRMFKKHFFEILMSICFSFVVFSLFQKNDIYPSPRLRVLRFYVITFCVYRWRKTCSSLFTTPLEVLREHSAAHTKTQCNQKQGPRTLFSSINFFPHITLVSYATMMMYRIFTVTQISLVILLAD